ncbi:hypothetical protein ABAL111652_00780 [Abyssicoccus albus]
MHEIDETDIIELARLMNSKNEIKTEKVDSMLDAFR